MAMLLCTTWNCLHISSSHFDCISGFHYFCWCWDEGCNEVRGQIVLNTEWQAITETGAAWEQSHWSLPPLYSWLGTDCDHKHWPGDLSCFRWLGTPALSSTLSNICSVAWQCVANSANAATMLSEQALCIIHCFQLFLDINQDWLKTGLRDGGT